MKLTIDVVGESYFKTNIESLGKLNPMYNAPDEKLISTAQGKRIFKYSFFDLFPVIIPEPNNPHDRNALRVDINGVKVGYISRDENVQIAQLLRNGNCTLSATIKGGKVRMVGQDHVEEVDRDYKVELEIISPLNLNMQNMQDKFYKKNWFIILMLILFWPAGLPLMWKFSPWSKTAKIIITVVIAVLVIWGLLQS